MNMTAHAKGQLLGRDVSKPASSPMHVAAVAPVAVATASGGMRRLRQTQITLCRANPSINASSVLYVPIAAEPEVYMPTAPSKTRISKVSWAGAGVYFFWQLGAWKYLQRQMDLTTVPMVGASAGALIAVLAACGVDPDLCLERAYQLSVEHQIWERPIGLAGVWGTLIAGWLDSLLPDDAADRCTGRVEIVVTEVPGMAQVAISDFSSKQDLIEVCMASAHVPFFLDWKLAKYCRGKFYVDGSLPDFFANANCDLLTCNGDSVVFDYFEDEHLVRKGRMDMLELKNYEEIRRIMNLGFAYADRLDKAGKLSKLHSFA